MICTLCSKEIERGDCVHISDNYFHNHCYEFITFACENTKIARSITHNIKKFRKLVVSEFSQYKQAKKWESEVKYHNTRLHKGWINEPMANFVDGAEDDFKNMSEVTQYLEQKQSEKRKIYSFGENNDNK